jgi:transcriptional regulator with XRE-family HTH domain
VEEEMEEFRCGTFMDWSFGGLLKRYRIEKEKTLRQRVNELGVDAGNYSKLERGILPPPASKKEINKYLVGLGLSPQKKQFIYQAAFNHHLGILQERFK